MQSCAVEPHWPLRPHQLLHTLPVFPSPRPRSLEKHFGDVKWDWRWTSASESNEESSKYFEISHKLLTHRILTRKILTHKLLTYTNFSPTHFSPTDFSQTDFNNLKISPQYDHHFCVSTCSVLITNSLASQSSQKACILILITHHRHHPFYGVSMASKGTLHATYLRVFCSNWQGLPPDP